MINADLSTCVDVRFGTKVVDFLYLGSQLIWQRNTGGGTETPDNTYTPLCFTALHDSVNLSMTPYNNTVELEYSVDNVTWNTWNITNSQFDTLTIAANESIYVRGKGYINPTMLYSQMSTFTTSGDGDLKCSGDIMSLLGGNELREYAFAQLFYNCRNLRDVSELTFPDTTTPWCYYGMFWNTRISSSPVLPALTLTDSCYYGMFYECGDLTQIKMLATDISANNCLMMWTTNVFYSGTFIQNYNVQLPLGENGIPEGWNGYYVDGTAIDYWPSSPSSFTVYTNGEWVETWNVDNPDSSRFDYVYGTDYAWEDTGTKTMTINISGYDTFKLYIRSSADDYSYWNNYVMVSELNQYIDGSTDKYDTSIKAHTADNCSYGTTLDDYTLVEFYVGGGDHTITIVYVRNDMGDNQGYVLIPNDQ